MAITKYQSGSNFERRVLKYLIGDNTHATSGYLHTLIPAVCHLPTDTPPMIYGIRAAGSRGDFDLLIVITMNVYTDDYDWIRYGVRQYVLGVQCKIGQLSTGRMSSDLRRIYKLHGMHGVYAYRDGREIKFYPELDKVIDKVMT